MTATLGSKARVDFNTVEGFLTLLKDLEEKKKDESIAIN
jgi:hypothetical protein